jgi:hypothetical protein
MFLVNAFCRKHARTVAYQMDDSVSGCNIPVFRRCLLSRCLANGLSGLSWKRMLESRYLAMDYFSIEASCHSIIIIANAHFIIGLWTVEQERK